MDKKTYKVIAENGIMANGGTIAPNGFINLFPNEPQTIALLEAHSIEEAESTEADSETNESLAAKEQTENGDVKQGGEAENAPTVNKYKVLNVDGIIEENGTTHATDDVVELNADADSTKTWIENGSIQEVTE